MAGGDVLEEETLVPRTQVAEERDALPPRFLRRLLTGGSSALCECNRGIEQKNDDGGRPFHLKDRSVGDRGAFGNDDDAVPDAVALAVRV